MLNLVAVWNVKHWNVILFLTVPLFLRFCTPHSSWCSFTADTNILLQTEANRYKTNHIIDITVQSHKISCLVFCQIFIKPKTFK